MAYGLRPKGSSTRSWEYDASSASSSQAPPPPGPARRGPLFLRRAAQLQAAADSGSTTIEDVTLAVAAALATLRARALRHIVLQGAAPWPPGLRGPPPPGDAGCPGTGRLGRQRGRDAPPPGRVGALAHAAARACGAAARCVCAVPGATGVRAGAGLWGHVPQRTRTVEPVLNRPCDALQACRPSGVSALAKRTAKRGSPCVAAKLSGTPSQTS